MINRASVPMWGIAGQSAGPPKWAGTKSVAGHYRSSGATDPILSTQRIPRSGDPIVSTQRIPRGRDRIFPTQRMGAMRQKMAIFRGGNSVCRVHFFQELSFYIQKELTNDFPDKFWKCIAPCRKSGGRCDRKWQFSKRETAFAGTQKFKFHFCLILNFEILNVWILNFLKFFRGQRWRALLMNTWNFRGATL